MLRPLAVVLLVSCGIVESLGSGTDTVPLAVVPTSAMEPLKAKLHTSWDMVSFDAASPSDLERAVALVPDTSMMVNASKLMGALDRLPNGRLFQLAMTGYDKLNLSIIPSRFAICNVHNSGTAIPEYVVSGILLWNTRLPQIDAQFRRCAFDSGAQGQDCGRPPVHGEARGQTVGIIGYGTLGSGVAVRAAALGMRVVAVTSPAPATLPLPLAWIGNDTMLSRLMREADFVIITCPLLPSTTNLVSPEMLSYMKPSSVLINVARGPIVDEAGLFRALETKKIGGAILDVWWQENYMNQTGSWSRFNFSALSNVWMTPHISYETNEAAIEGIVEVAANLDALARAEPLRNIVRNATIHSLSNDLLAI